MQIRNQRLFRKIWPRFFFHQPNIHLDSFYTFSDYSRIWYLCICILSIASLAPLMLATMTHYKLIQSSVDSELMLRTERLTSNAKRSIAFFMDERLDALNFTINEMGYQNLNSNIKLKKILSNLKQGFGGYTDLSIIDHNGNQIAYSGPYNLEGKSYKNQMWFIRSLETDNFVSEVFTGYRDAPHIIITARSQTPTGVYFILRATIDTERLMQMLMSYKPSIHTDMFLMNHKGVLQTPSTNFGDVFTKTALHIPEFSTRTKVERTPNAGNKKTTIMMGYSYISTDNVTTPFILMVRKEKEGVMRTWLDLGKTFNWIVGISGIIIIAIVTIISNFMVNKMYTADRTKAQTMLQMEESHQLASIGQLAAGVAHEINNPLALINQTAGYVKDMYSFSDETISNEEISEHIDSIIEATERCGAITSQLLGFVRQFDIKIRKIDLGKMISNVLSFHKKEAEYRNINLSTSFPSLPLFMRTDSGKLQQILVNLVSNAFQALDDDGCLNIIATLTTSQQIEIIIKDTGCGIPEENIKSIHEPFFSTKKEDMGTGLGLSITYGLVKKLKGHICVESTEGVGTIFTVTLPVRIEEDNLV